MNYAGITNTLGYTRKEPEEAVEPASMPKEAAPDYTASAAADSNAHTERVLTAVLENVEDAVIVVDDNWHVVQMNPSAERLTGWKDDEAAGRALHALLAVTNDAHGESIDTVIARFEETGADRLKCKWAIAKNGGGILRIDGTIVRVNAVSEVDVGALITFHESDQAQRLTETISFQASHDALTGLANRDSLYKSLGRLLDKPADATHALIHVDVDQFKVINDTWGSAAGDHLLRRVTAVIKSVFRSGDTAARIGNDEFAILLEHISVQRAHEIALRLLSSITEERFDWGGSAVVITASIGLVIIDQDNRDVPAILATAEQACGLARELGGNRVQLFEDASGVFRKRRGDMEWTTRLRAALTENRLLLYYQPIVPIGDPSKQAKCEILIRLRDIDGSIVLPGDFLPAAERYNLIPAIDRWVVSNTFATYRKMLDAGLPAARDYTICVNLSGTSLADTTLLDFITAEFARTGVPPDRFCFEVTETAAIGNVNTAIRLISDLKDLGCTFSLDDFGSGFSSFTYLKNLPIDHLKIDGSFVKDMAVDPINHSMVEAINALGKLMKVETIAEFVSSRSILNRLKEIGVDYAQGFGVATPEPFTT